MTEPIVEIHFKWAGMHCKNCYRFSPDLKTCDLNGPQSELNYCCLYVPRPTLFNREKLVSLFYQHVQRWIREPGVDKK